MNDRDPSKNREKECDRLEFPAIVLTAVSCLEKLSDIALLPMKLLAPSNSLENAEDKPMLAVRDLTIPFQ
jgi:hypothetical protein